jgi:hypothetical protein
MYDIQLITRSITEYKTILGIPGVINIDTFNSILTGSQPAGTNRNLVLHHCMSGNQWALK